MCVLVDYFFYFLFIHTMKVAFIAKILSSIISVSLNYVLNSRFNFSNKQKINAKFYFSYILMYAFLILLNALINMVLIRSTSDVPLSFWIAAIVAAFTNYFSVKFYFKKINAKPIIS